MNCLLFKRSNNFEINCLIRGPQMPRKGHLAWTITLNNPNDHPPIEDNFKYVRFLEYQLEIGENGTPHLQGYVQFYKSMGIKGIKNMLKNQALHLEPQMGTSEQAIHYIRKPIKDCSCKHCLVALKLPPPKQIYSRGTPDLTIKPFVIPKAKNSKKDLATEILDEIDNGNNTIEYFIENHREYTYHNYAKLTRWLEIKTIIFQESRFKPENFNIPKSVTKWTNSIYKYRTLFLEGDSGLGKTQMMLALYPRALKINDLDDAKDLRPEHTAIIYDDCNWQDSTRPHVLSFIDSECISKPKCRYHNAKIPANFPRIIISNEPDFITFPECCLTKDKSDVKPEIGRRLSKTMITQKLF